MKVVTTITEARAARRSLGTLGLVPTMGFLHAGHLSLVHLARQRCDAAAVSIFVNPAQFAPTEDLARYPRDLPRDLDMLREAGVDLAFVPGVDQIYPTGFATHIDVGPVAHPLEGAIRPGHFSGVATVVAKLFNIVQPDIAFFGQKDAQQAAVIQRLVRDLDFPLEIVIGDTVREPDGLALSSRNAYLSDEQRRLAPRVHQALRRAAERFDTGERSGDALRQAIRAAFDGVAEFSVDYASIADAVTLQELERVEERALASVAVRLGTTRLIDNLILSAGPLPSSVPTRPETASA